MINIYLMGQISTRFPETYKWRERFREDFLEDGRFGIIDPCNNGFNQGVLESTNGDDSFEQMRKKILATKGVDIIVPKDRYYVKISDIGVANLNQYDSDKPLIGTFFELAWYYDKPHKTVIGFFNGDKNNIYMTHPFIKKTVTVWVDNEYDAADLIRKYFGDYV